MYVVILWGSLFLLAAHWPLGLAVPGEGVHDLAKTASMMPHALANVTNRLTNLIQELKQRANDLYKNGSLDEAAGPGIKTASEEF